MEQQYRYVTAQGLEKLPQAAAIREEVFVEEQGFHNEFDDIDRQAVHLVVMDGEAPAAAGRVEHLGRGAARCGM